MLLNPMTKPMGKVFLVGAGPGDPELITVRALRHLKTADLVLHDALVHPDLLRWCGEQTELRYVGKRGGNTANRQTSINKTLAEEARKGKRVVRLKGGDPFLFGRGSEEAEYLAAAGIEFEVVPGVPSPMAATAYAGISLTHRELSSSVAYLTATESPQKDRSAHDWAKLATATQTLVIFMGMRKLEGLMQLLMDHGRDADCPAAVVQSASLPSQRVVVGTVSTIADLAHKAGIGMPALTIVGQVVSLRDRLRWYDHKPLFGKSVWVTRMSHQRDGMCNLLRDAGARPIAAATIVLEPLVELAMASRAMAEPRQYDWVVFTSANGVRCFWQVLERLGLDARALGQAKVAAIGPATRDVLLSKGISADVMPERFVAEQLRDALMQYDAAGLKDTKILLPRAEHARDLLPQALRDAGSQVEVLPVYRSVKPAPEDAERVVAMLRHAELDAVTFTSSSTVDHAMALLGKEALSLLEGVTVGCIGPITAETAKKHGLHVDVVADDYTSAGLVKALEAYFKHD